MNWFVGFVVLATSILAQNPRDVGQTPRVIKQDVGPVAVTIDVPAERIGLADSINLSVTLLAPANAEVKWPTFVPAARDAISFDAPHTIGPDKVDRFMLRRWKLAIEPLRLGSLDLGSLEIEARLGTDPWTKEKIDLPRFEVLKGPTSSADVKTLRPVPIGPQPKELSPGDWLRFAGVVVFFAALLIWGVSHRKPKPPATRADNADDAIRMVDELHANADPQSGGGRPFVDQCSGIVRAYLERQYRLSAPRQTTPEFLGHPHTARVLADSQQMRLAEFLAASDLDKFAERIPSPAACRLCYQRARTFLVGEGQEART